MFQHPAHGSGRGFVKLNVPYVVWLVLDPPIQQNCACYAFPVSLKAKPINLPLHKFVCLHTPAVYLPMFDSCCLMIPSYNNKQLINYINTGSPSIPSDKRQANNFTCSYLYIYITLYNYINTSSHGTICWCPLSGNCSKRLWALYLSSSDWAAWDVSRSTVFSQESRNVRLVPVDGKFHTCQV
jgi:hypothetical protein